MIKCSILFTYIILLLFYNLVIFFNLVFRIYQGLELKLVSTIFCQIFIFSPNDSPLKTMKNAFYFI